MHIFLEKYSRGRRGAPAKGVGRETGARVQIPPSPPIIQYSTLRERSIEQSNQRTLLRLGTKQCSLFLRLFLRPVTSRQ